MENAMGRPGQCFNMIFKLLLVLFFFNIHGEFYAQNNNSQTEKKTPTVVPRIVLTDSSGRKLNRDGVTTGINAFIPHDNVFGSFFNLTLFQSLSINVIRSDGKIISSTRYTTDKSGMIPTSALWWDIGIIYDAKGIGKLDRNFAKYSYYCVIKQGKKTIHQREIIVTTDVKKPLIYSSNKAGDAQNRYTAQKDDVYITGKFFDSLIGNQEEIKLYIYVVSDRWSWNIGDRLESYEVEKYVKRLRKGETQFTQLLWQRNDLEFGSYDIIITCKPFGIIFDKDDLIHSEYGVGFKVIDPGKKRTDEILLNLACQGPPQVKLSGIITTPPIPRYKDYFSPNESVWIALDSHGKHLETKSGKARIYIIPYDPNKPLKDRDPLMDISGGYEEILPDPQCDTTVYTRVWDKPEIRDDGYQIIMDFKPFGIYNIGQDVLDGYKKNAQGQMIHKGFYVPEKWVCLESLSFNHTTNAITGDGVTIRQNRNTAVRVPEFMKGRQSFPAAYVKNSRITVRPEFSFSDGIFNAKIIAYARSGELADLKSMYVNVSNNKLSNPYYFQVRQNTPNSILSFYQVWEWYLRGIRVRKGKRIVMDEFEEEIHIATTINKIYIILSTPQTPWSYEGETAPWIEVMDLSSQLAFGKTTSEAAASELTRFLYSACGGEYKRDDSQYSANNVSSVNADFKIDLFLKNIPKIGNVNCYDMAKALVTFSNVIGCGLDLRYSYTFGTLNYIQPIGLKWTPNITFSDHAFGAIADNIFDASLQVDTWGNPANPPHRATWIYNIPWFEYQDMMLQKTSLTKPVYPEIVFFKFSNQKN
jgi:hypothetical protein